MRSKTESEKRTDLAENRTDWAEDRTIMANERTYAGWMRTGLASAGIGLGFNAIFKQIEPTWLAKGIASIFIMIAILIFISAYRNARAIVKRMNTHAVNPVTSGHLKLITALFVAGGILLTAVMWMV